MKQDQLEESILNLIKIALFGGAKVSLRPEDETAILAECQKQAILLVANEAIATSSTKWNMAVNNLLVNNLRIKHAHEEIGHLFKEKPIPMVIIKGLASAAYYPKPYTRTLGDIDFFIERKDIEIVDQLLKENGYQATSPLKGAHHHVNYQKDDCHYEMHFSLNGIPDGKLGEKVSSYLTDMLKTSKEVNGLSLPDQFHHGLVILLHNARHMTSSGIGLRHLVDWACFVNEVGDKFEALFEKPLKDIGLWEYANILTATCVYGIGLNKPHWCKNYDEKLLKGIIADIFNSGNLGHKQSEVHSGWFISNINGQVGKSGYVGSFINSLNRLTDESWPIAKKIVILYPIGWLVFSLRHLIRIKQGKRRKIKIKETFKQASVKRNLYQSFHLFEIEE